MWDVVTYERRHRLEGHTDAVTCLAQDGNFLISGSDDRTIKVWDLNCNFLLRTLAVHSRSVQDVLVIPSLGYIASCARDGQVLVWNYVTDEILHTFSYDEEVGGLELRCRLISLAGLSFRIWHFCLISFLRDVVYGLTAEGVLGCSLHNDAHLFCLSVCFVCFVSLFVPSFVACYFRRLVLNINCSQAPRVGVS